MALTAVADAVDALGGDSSAIRSKIETIEDTAVSMAEYQAAMGAHITATAGAVDLLINQSHFDGNIQQ